MRQVAILLHVLKFALALGMVEKPSRGINEIAKGGITVGRDARHRFIDFWAGTHSCAKPRPREGGSG